MSVLSIFFAPARTLLLATFVMQFGIASSFADPDTSRAFQVVGQQGKVHFTKGHLEFVNFKADDEPKTNTFGQYKGSTTETKAHIVFQETAAHELILTEKKSTLRLLLRDDSIIDVGPDTILEISEFNLAANLRNVTLRCLRGKLRILVTRKYEGQSTYRVETPGTTTWVRGTDFAVHVITPQESDTEPSQTFVLGIRGQVTTDLSRLANDGRVFLQTLIVNTYSLLSASTADGFTLKSTLQDHLESREYDRAYAEHSVLGDIHALPLGRPLEVADLPGTGVVSGKARESTESFLNGLSHEDDALDKEHPLPLQFQKVHGFQADNFTVPSDLDTHPWNRRTTEDFWLTLPVSSAPLPLLPFAQQNIHSPNWAAKP